MILHVQVDMDYAIARPTDLILQIEAAAMADQRILSESLTNGAAIEMRRAGAEGGVGTRRLMRSPGDFLCAYRARIAVKRPCPALRALSQTPPHQLPADAVRYLMPSRYCPTERFQSFAADRFGGLAGGAMIAAMRDWIGETHRYVPGISTSSTTALDTFVDRRGVCRDFAHVLIALARAMAIPARYVSVYAPGVNPPDFHAVVEVFLQGAWHLVDPTGMARADQMARIAVGMDAAEVAFLNNFGAISLRQLAVSVRLEPERA